MNVRIEYYNREVEEFDNVNMVFKADHRVDCKNGDIFLVPGDVINFRIKGGKDKVVPLNDIEHLSIYQSSELKLNEHELALIKRALKHDAFEEERKEAQYKLCGDEESDENISEAYKQGIRDLFNLFRENSELEYMFPNKYLIDKDIVQDFLKEKGV